MQFTDTTAITDKIKLQEYYQSLPKHRKERLTHIRDTWKNTDSAIKETFRYSIPTFEIGDNWACIASQKNYISIYFCSEDLISEVKDNHPELNYGKGCIRVKDSQEVPIESITKAFIKAMTLEKT